MSASLPGAIAHLRGYSPEELGGVVDNQFTEPVQLSLPWFTRGDTEAASRFSTPGPPLGILVKSSLAERLLVLEAEGAMMRRDHLLRR